MACRHTSKRFQSKFLWNFACYHSCLFLSPLVGVSCLFAFLMVWGGVLIGPLSHHILTRSLNDSCTLVLV